MRTGPDKVRDPPRPKGVGAASLRLCPTCAIRYDLPQSADRPIGKASFALRFGYLCLRSSVFRPIVRLSLPLAALHLGQVAMGLVDTAFLGRVGQNELAAVGLGNAIYFTVSIFGQGLVQGAEPFISQAAGAGDAARGQRTLLEARRIVGLSLLPLWLLLGVVLLALPHLGLSAEVVQGTQSYVLGRAPGIPGFLLFIATQAFLQAQSKTRAIVTSIVVANLVNVPADLLLILGDSGLRAWGLPPCGIAGYGVLGAGLATSIASWVRFFWVLPATRSTWREMSAALQLPPAELEIAQNPSWRGVNRIARVGTPVGAQLSVEVAIFACVSLWMGTLGATQLAAHQVALSLSSVPFSITIGVGSATSVVVGRCIGAGHHSEALRAGLAGIAVGIGVMICTGSLFLWAPEMLIQMVTRDPDVCAAATDLVRIAGFFALSDGIQAVASGALRGAGDTKWPFAIHLVAHWCVGMPTAWLLGFGLELGAPGLWWGLTAGLSFAALSLTTRFVIRGRKGFVALATDGPTLPI